MARVSKEIFRFEKGHNSKGNLMVEIVVYVNSSGLFTATLPSEVLPVLHRAKIKTLNNRAGNDGFYQASTKKGLLLKISDDFKKALSGKVINESIILKYGVKGMASWWEDLEGGIHPNGQGASGGGWKGGNINLHAANKAPYGVMVAVKAYRMTEHEFLDGEKTKEYSVLQQDSDEAISDENLRFITRLSCISFGSDWQHGKVEQKDLEYTKERAKFFAELIKGIYGLVEMISILNNSEGIDLMIESKTKLLK